MTREGDLHGSGDEIVEEPQGFIAVKRVKILGTNFLGRPRAELTGSQVFRTFDEVAAYVTEEPSYTHSIEFSLPEDMRVSARLEGPRRGEGEMLVVGLGDQRSVSPRFTEGHHSVSTNYESSFDIVVLDGTREDARLDRRLAWVRVPSSTLAFYLQPGITNPDDVRSEIDRVTIRTTQVLQDLLQGRS